MQMVVDGTSAPGMISRTVNVHVYSSHRHALPVVAAHRLTTLFDVAQVAQHSSIAVAAVADAVLVMEVVKVWLVLLSVLVPQHLQGAKRFAAGCSRMSFILGCWCVCVDDARLSLGDPVHAAACRIIPHNTKLGSIRLAGLGTHSYKKSDNMCCKCDLPAGPLRWSQAEASKKQCDPQQLSQQ